MLIICDGCQSKIRAPDSVAGKRVKCPKCAAVIRVPKPESSEAADPESTGISTTPIPPPPPPPDPEPEPEPEATPEPEPEPVTPDDSPANEGTEVTESRPSKSGTRPPPLRTEKKRADAVSDEDEDEEDDFGKRRKRKRRRDEDDDDDDDDLSIKKKSRREADGPTGMAITSMVLGIVALVTYLLGVCCLGSATSGISSIVACPIAVICAIVSLILGFMGNKPGSAGYAWTGIACSLTVIAFLLLGVIMIFVFGAALLGLGAAAQQQPPRRF